MEDSEKYITEKEAYEYLGGKSRFSAGRVIFMRSRRDAGLKFRVNLTSHRIYKIKWIEEFLNKQNTCQESDETPEE